MSIRLRVTTCQARNTFPLMERVTRHLVGELGLDAVYIDDIPWQERYAQLGRGDMHLVWICGRPLAESLAAGDTNLDGLAVPVMRGELYGGRPVYFSYVVVRKEQLANSLADLRGARFAINEPGSQSGCHSLRQATRGFGPDHVGEWIESGSHANSIRMVADGEVDVAAIDSTYWEYEEARELPQLAQLRTIDVLGPYPAPPLVAHSSLSDELRAEIRRCVLSMHLSDQHREVLRESQVERFVPADMESYRALITP